MLEVCFGQEYAFSISEKVWAQLTAHEFYLIINRVDVDSINAVIAKYESNKNK